MSEPNKVGWNVSELKKNRGFKTFRIDWAREYTEYGHTYIEAKSKEEAEKLFWEYPEDDEVIDDSESGETWIRHIEEEKD